MATNPFDQFDAVNPFDQFDNAQAVTAAAPPSLGGTIASAFVRPVAKGLAALPLMAMDAGVAGRNILGNAANKLMGRPATANYDMPSSMFDQSLDSLTVAPQTRTGRIAETVSSMVVGAGLPAPKVGNQVPANFKSPQQAMREEILRRASEEGYVVPPSSANPSFANRFMEGWAGKTKLNQEAGIRNQSITDMLMARSVGESGAAPITQGTLQTIRSGAAASGYSPVRTAGSITTDAKYLSQLDGITKAAQGASRSFPGISAKSPIDDVVAALRQGKFDAGDGVDALAYLRDQADSAFSAGNKALGKSYKAASKAIEDMIERGLAAKGEDGQAMLKAFREARELMAKTYSAGKAMVGETGNFDARKVASELARGKPMTGDQRLVGNFATAFGKYTPKPNGENFPSISPLDTYGSAMVAGAADSAVPFLYPLSRIGMRQYLLSQAGQANAIATPSIPRFMGAAGAVPASSGLF